jgi:hypothetical protein
MRGTIKISSRQNLRYGEFSVEVMENEAEREEKELHEIDVDRKVKNSEESTHSTVDESTLEYCEHCFLSFGVKERRVLKSGKVVHETCAIYVQEQ